MKAAKATGGAISFTLPCSYLTNSGTFHNPTSLTVDFLMVGAGGGGGGDNGRLGWWRLCWNQLPPPHHQEQM